jgi:hypothetical protein
MRKLYWMSIALFVFVASLGFAQWPRPGITMRNYHRIEVGMTEDEVAELMGEPPHRTGWSPNVGAFCPIIDSNQRSWGIGDGREILITLSEDRVTNKQIFRSPTYWRVERKGPLETLCARLGI